MAAIGEIVGDPAMSATKGRRTRGVMPLHRKFFGAFPGVLHAACVLGAVFLVSSEAAAERIMLLSFDGGNGRALRWRVAGALKRSGHTVIGVAPPKNPSDAKLRAFAKRRKVDLFIEGSSVQGNDGWELTLTVRDPEGEPVGKGVTLSAPSYRAMLKELKEDGPSEIEGALRGRGPARPERAREDEEPPARAERSSSDDEPPARAKPSSDDEEQPSAADFAGNARALAKKKRRAEPVAIDLDGNGGDASSGADESVQTSRAAPPSDESTSDESPASDEGSRDDSQPRTAKASGWASSDSTPDDDGRKSFLAGDDGSESGEVGVDDDAASAKESVDDTDYPTVVVGLNAGFVRRTLEYSDNLYGRLRAPSANSWVYRLQAAFYPFAKPVKNRIGLIAGYESEFSGVVRDNRAGTDFGVTFSELYGGLKLRQPLGKHELALEGTVGSMQAGLDDPDGVSRVPQFSYTSLRAAVDVGLHFGALAMHGALGYRLPVGGYGEASDVDWFPRMEGYGLEGSLGLEYRISKEVAFDVSANMRRYLLQMNSRPQDALDGTSEVAGGAVDLYLGGYFGLNIAL
jgi:hypothetical protein